MIPVTHLPTLGVVVGLYGAIGVAVAALLLVRGEPRSTAMCALGAWPALVGLLGRRPPPPGGPFGEAIRRAFEPLQAAGPGGGGAPFPWTDELAVLRAAVERTDQRLAHVDALLAELEALSPDDRDVRSLRAARERVAAELEGVLAGLRQLRIQVGLLALSEARGALAVQVRDRLRDLGARVAALDEVAVVVPREAA